MHTCVCHSRLTGWYVIQWLGILGFVDNLRWMLIIHVGFGCVLILIDGLEYQCILSAVPKLCWVSLWTYGCGTHAWKARIGWQCKCDVRLCKNSIQNIAKQKSLVSWLQLSCYFLGPFCRALHVCIVLFNVQYKFMLFVPKKSQNSK